MNRPAVSLTKGAATLAVTGTLGAALWTLALRMAPHAHEALSLADAAIDAAQCVASALGGC